MSFHQTIVPTLQFNSMIISVSLSIITGNVGESIYPVARIY